MTGFSQLRVRIRRGVCSCWSALALLLVFATLAPAQGPITFQHFYDDLNQLVRVIDSTGVMIQYVYDPVGNMLQVVRSTVTPGALTIFNITPVTTPTGTTITIQGQGFSTTPSANLVTVNGVALTVVSATSTTLVVQITANATTGTISVTVGGVTVVSSSPETILPSPIIPTLAPKATPARTPSTLTASGSNLNGSSFTSSPSLTIAAAAINAGGTSSTLIVSPEAFNTIRIPAGSPDADADGPPNAQEPTLAGSCPDGLEVQCRSAP